MKVQLVGMLNGPTFDSVDDFMEVMSEMKLTYQGKCEESHIVEYLQGLPKYKELSGPLGGQHDSDGNKMARYETWEVFNFLSS
jgi:hypothetical protein